MINIKQTVLIVDDTTENIDIIAEALDNKYRMKAVTNGVDAIEIAKSNPPDLILLDIMMPEMDGYETIQHLKRIDKTRNIPVIFLTAKSGEQDISKGYKLGAVDYISKPFFPSEVYQRVKIHIDLQQKTQKLETSCKQLEELHEKEIQYQNYIKKENVRLDMLVKQKTENLEKAQEKLKESLKELQQLDKAKSDFLSMISHELKTPLTGLVAIEMLFSGECTLEEDGEFLQETFYDTYNKLSTIVEHAITLTSLNVGIAGYRKEKYSVLNLIKAAQYQVQSFAESRGCKIITQQAEDVTVRFNKHDMELAVSAIFRIAIRFSDNSSPIKVYWKVNDSILSISIKVNGYIIPEEFIDKMFKIMSISETFFPGGDLGLGLAVAKEIIQIHEGEITVENLPCEKGVIFIIKLQY